MARKKESFKRDMFELLLEASEKKSKSRRTQLLEILKVKEFFEGGSISINDRTCHGIECELCIKVCPTKALFWQNGKVGIIEDLCVYCGACVVNCIVDDCIKIRRKRSDGEIESFSKPLEVFLLFGNINSQKRRSRVESILADAEAYLKRYVN